jgi:hypothetical protein
MLNILVTAIRHFPTEPEEWAGQMDSYREHPNDFDLPSATQAADDDVAAAIGTDERRMHVRAYNYWVSLLEGRDFPSIEELEPGDVQDFAPNSVLLDFTCSHNNPAVPYIGGAIRDECGLDEATRTIADVPSRSLLSRLTDHYLQIIANRAPVGFEAEFENQRSENICYRGILMPFSSDGDTIDFIYGVINWKTVDQPSPQVAAGPSVTIDRAVEPMVEPDFETEPALAPLGIEQDPVVMMPAPLAEHLIWEDGPNSEDDAIPTITLDEHAGLADRLSAARETADAVKSADGRTRVALYRALALAYDFAVAAQQNPEDYAELLEESGLKAQARAPMTPIVKLVFGIDYDKARLTEFAAALSYAQRQAIELGGFQDFIERQAGGLKALVAAEREARCPEPRPDNRGEAARSKLRQAPVLSLADLAIGGEFAVIVTRRSADGGHEPVAILSDEALIERAIRRAI